jgi:Leucine-rich repeat (LRR) protein
LKHLKVISTLSFKNNSLGDMGDLSEPLGSMERLKKLDFRGNPLAGLPKYRDYIVILAKNLCKYYETQRNLTQKTFYLLKDNTL